MSSPSSGLISAGKPRSKTAMCFSRDQNLWTNYPLLLDIHMENCPFIDEFYWLIMIYLVNTVNFQFARLNCQQLFPFLTSEFRWCNQPETLTDGAKRRESSMWTPPILPIQTSPWCRGVADECWTDDQMVSVCPSNPKKGWKSRYIVTIFQFFLMIPNYPTKKQFLRFCTCFQRFSTAFPWKNVPFGSPPRLLPNAKLWPSASSATEKEIPKLKVFVGDHKGKLIFGNMLCKYDIVSMGNKADQILIYLYIYIYILMGTIMTY